MDITLERILSLIPHKPDGSFEHGAKVAFAQSVGLKNGNLVSDWIKGRTRSYENYLYEIAAKYHVSVAWLKGDTDDPTPDGIEADTQEVIDLLGQIPPELRSHAIEILRGLAQSGSKPGET